MVLTPHRTASSLARIEVTLTEESCRHDDGPELEALRSSIPGRALPCR